MKGLLLVVAATLGLVSALPQLSTVYQFPEKHWIENMAVRKNGQILATDLSNGVVYLVDPSQPHSVPPVVAQFPEGSGIIGITEVQDDVFYVSSFKGDAYTISIEPNSTSIWEINMRPYAATRKALVRKVVDIPEAPIINGMTPLSKSDHTILMADSFVGLIWKLNVKNAKYEIVWDNEYIKPTKSLGVNGIHVVESSTGLVLYFSNYNRGLLGRVCISRSGTPTGPPTLITTSVPVVDDFAVDENNNIWAALSAQDKVVRVSALGGVVQTVAELHDPVAAVFGRGNTDEKTLYISTAGVSRDAQGNLLTSNGQIAKFDTNAV